jgi:putative DNA-invertase from lambdoid prophage Rac
VKAGIYMRVSTTKQDAENQRPELEQLALARRWSAEFHEETESGAKVRPILDGLCDRAVKGQVGAVVVWSLDRLGRNAAEVIARVNRLLAANVRVVSLREPWLEQDGPARELLLFIFAWVAQQERRRLIERTNAGLDKARAKGTRLGRPVVPLAALEAAYLFMTEPRVSMRAACRATVYEVERMDRKTGKVRKVTLAVSVGAFSRWLKSKGGAT